MTPPQPEEPTLPPRHRPSLETFVKDSREEDLWDLAEPPADASQEAAPVQVLPRKSMPGAPLLPAGEPAATVGDPAPVLAVTVTPRRQTSQSTNVARLGRVRIMRDTDASDHPLSPIGAPASANVLEDAFNSLDDWDVPAEFPDDSSEAGPDTVPQRAVDPLPVPAAPAPLAPTTPSIAEAQAEAEAQTGAPAQAADQGAAEPAAKPLALRFHLGLSKLEGIALVALGVVLLAGGYWVYDHSLSRVLRQAGQAQQISFPVRGVHLTISNVVSYWREPIKTGNHVEAVRRGVGLIPVTEITVQGGPCAIRTLVYNDSGVAVGDPITRSIDGTTTLILPATDGFEDISMLTAYRTGQTKPWTVRIFEAPSANSQGKDFKKLLELPVSAEKR